MTFEETILHDIAFLGKYYTWEHLDYIYHYTSPQAFQNILDNKNGNITLWFSKYDSLNDASEGMQIIDLFNKQLKELYDDNQINKKYYELLYVTELKRKMYFFKNMEHWCKVSQEEYDIYLCCFSKNNDSLPLWNYYLKNNCYEGYNIGVSFFDYEDLIGSDSLSSNFHLNFYEVEYSDQTKNEKIRNKILEYYKFYIEDNNRSNDIKKIISAWLDSQSIIFKNEHFIHEQEVRAVLKIPKGTGKIQSKTITISDIMFRDKKGLIIPYVEVSFPMQCIKKVTIPPLTNDVLALKNMKYYLDKNNYKEVIINTSTVPIRY